MRKTANTLGLTNCTISCIVKRVTTAISTELAGIYMHLPQTENELKESAANFYKQYGFPQCNGAHIVYLLIQHTLRCHNCLQKVAILSKNSFLDSDFLWQGWLLSVLLVG